MSQTIPMFLHLLAGLFGAAGQCFYKKGGEELGTTPLWSNWWLMLGILSFCLVMVFFVMSYKMGGRISAVYPAYATTFIWGAALGCWLDGERMNTSMAAGIGLILLGVAAIGWGVAKP